MLKKTITYTDFSGNQQTEDFYFNLTKAEVVAMELSENLNGGLSKMIEDVVAANDGRRIMEVFNKVITMSYGIRGADGKSFIKNEITTEGFLGSEPYSELFMELISNPDKAAEFVREILPKDVDPGKSSIPSNVRQPSDFQKKETEPKDDSVKSEADIRRAQELEIERLKAELDARKAPSEKVSPTELPLRRDLRDQ